MDDRQACDVRQWSATNAGVPRQSVNITYVHTSSMLAARVNREAIVVAEQFDMLCHEYVKDIDEVYSAVAALTYFGMKQSEVHRDEMRKDLSVLLSNALKSFTAAFSLLRTGWRLQPYLCIRNSYEGLSVAVHLITKPEDFELFREDKLDSTSTFKSAKKLLPIFGQIYGNLSEQFTHIGRPFRYVQQGNTYSENEADLWGCLSQLMLLIWFLYWVVELAFYDWVPNPQFWKQVGENAYQFSPTAEAQKWKARLLARYKGKVAGFA
jgi:hypothetical protein